MTNGRRRSLMGAVIVLAALNVILVVAVVAVLNLGSSDQPADQPVPVDAPPAAPLAEQTDPEPAPQAAPELPREPASVDELEAAIKVGSFQTTLEAVESVQRAGPAALEAAISELARLTTDESLPVRVQTAYAIGLLGSEAATAADELVALLEDDSALVRRQAADALVRIEQDVVPVLVEALGDSSPEGQEYAAYALAQLGPASKFAVSKLAGLVREGDKLLRVKAAQALYRIDPDVAVPVLADALDDSESIVRGTAATLLGSSGAKGKVALGPLAEMLYDEADQVAQSAAIALARIDQEAALPILTEAMSKSDEKIVRAATHGLKLLDSDASVALLIERLNHSSPTTRALAATVLGDLGSGARRAVPALSQSLDDESDAVFRAALASLKHIQRNAAVPALIEVVGHEKPELRCRAIYALQAIGTRAADSLPQLREAVQDDSSYVQTAAASALWTIGADAETAVPVLIELLGHEDRALRVYSARVLGSMGKEAAPAVDALVGAVAHEDIRTHRAARSALILIDEEALTRAYLEVAKQQNPLTFSRVADSLAEMRVRADDEAIQALSDAVDSKDERVQQDAVRGLAQFERRARSAVPLLLERLRQALEEEDRSRFETALRALDRIDKQAWNAALVEVLERKDPVTFRWVSDSLYGPLRGTEELIPALIRAIQAEDARVQQQAIQGLYSFGAMAKAAVPALIDALKAQDMQVRFSAMSLLGRIGPEAHDAVPALREALDDSNPSVRRSAQQALQSIDPEAARDGSDEP